jgi:hypothetical protein
MLVDGVVASGQVGLRAASAATPGEAQDLSKHRRAQRLLANPRLDVNRAQRRLVTHVLRRCHGRVDLLLDATATGATATDGDRRGDGDALLRAGVAGMRHAAGLAHLGGG